MMNEYNQKTAVRTRRMPFRPAPNPVTDQSVNVLPIGTHLGEFEILDLIGEGGFGIVYLAYDHSLERQVALKEYMPSGLATRTTSMAVTVRSQHNLATFTAGLKSFINEARMLAQFDSPALVKVHRFWEGNGTAYMVMPFYEGVTLKQALKEHRITPTEPWIRVLLADLFDAIETIHRAQCLHRDIAPDNILLLKDGRPLLLDFGAARRVIGDLTQCLTVILKPGFAPIEQYADIAGLRQGAWTDIYALMAVVYYLIAGKAPPPAVARMVKDELVPAREAGKGRYSNGFLSVLDKGLSVKPEQRFRSIAELRRALDIMDTTPRTLPREMSRWSTTIVRTRAVTDAKPDVKPDVKPEKKPDSKPAMKPATKPEMKPATKPELKPEANPIPQTIIQPASDWKKPNAEAGARKSRNSKTEWLVLALLLSAGIASGVYLGTNRSWERSLDQSAAPSESSGASEVPDEESTDQAVATVPPPNIAASKPPASSSAAAQPERDNTPQSAPRQPSEIELWRMAAISDKASAYENYLRQFPDGRYAGLARLRLERKQPTAPVAAAPGIASPVPQEKKAKATAPVVPEKSAARVAEEEFWTITTSINEAPAYEGYLNKYPKGRYAALARDRIASRSPKEPTDAGATPSPPAPAKQDVPDVQPVERAPERAEKLASIRPPEPSVPPTPKREIEAAPKPMPEPSISGGKKTLKLADQTMTGDFSVDPKTGIVSGTGKIAWTNGNQFEGTLVRGMKEGKGKFSWNNGQRYSGDWARDMPNGKGTIVFSDGSRYEGEVKDGVPHGQGMTRFKDGDTYNGAWVRGKSHGHGRYTWANGSYWEGEFRDDKRTENGKMVFSESALRAAGGAPAGETQGQEHRAAVKD